jgi:3-phenylpropionate/cinnamic acid dioxygenase small subunit
VIFASDESPSMPSRHVGMRESDYADVLEFYFQEARLLDEDRFAEWLELLAPDLTYRMPIRVTRRRGDGDGFSDGTGHFYDNRASVEIRVRRLIETASAYAEDPASRVRRLVNNLRLEERADGLWGASTYLLLLRNRFDSPTYDLLSGERVDLLRRRADGSFEVVRREFRADQTTLGLINVAIFV